jgi:predicted ester cyclase
VPDQADTERYMNMARRWFNQGWPGNIALADDLSSENIRTNGFLVGMAGPERRIEERLAAFPDLTTTIEDMLSTHDKIATRLVWRGTHTGRYGPSRPLAGRWRSVTLPFGASQMARWRKSRRYRISSRF